MKTKIILLISIILSGLPIYADEAYIVKQYTTQNFGIREDHYNMSDGSEIVYLYSKCTQCLGAGMCRACAGMRTCNICFGKGGVFYSYSGWQRCMGCGGSGRCSVCQGSGKCGLCSKSSTPGYQLGGVIQKKANGETVTLDMTNRTSIDNMTSSRRSSSKKTSCRSCNGTGIDPTVLSYWGGVSSYLGHYNSPNSKCPYCGRMHEHYHSKCRQCNVPSY